MEMGEQTTQLAEAFASDSRSDRAIFEKIVLMEEVIVVALSEIAGELVDEKNLIERSPENEIVELALVGGDALCRMTGQSERFNIAVGMGGDGLAHQSVPCGGRVPAAATLVGVFLKWGLKRGDRRSCVSSAAGVVAESNGSRQRRLPSLGSLERRDPLMTRQHPLVVNSS